MQQRPLGQSNIRASVVGLGTWAIGGWCWGGTDENESVAAIRAAMDEGINLIDTAPAYGFGRSEELVGDAIRGRRDKAIIATKCALMWDQPAGKELGTFFFDSDGESFETKKPDRKVYRLLSPDSIRRELEASLRRLKTDYIDLYQTHWQDPTTPIADTMACLLDLKKRGKIRAIGVCNATPVQMDAYRAAGQLDSDQEPYSMLDRGIESSQLPYCRTGNIAVLAYSPLALGILTGKITADRTFPASDIRASNPRFGAENRAKVLAMLDAFQPIARKHKLTTAQLVIEWTLAQPGVTHALIGARNPKQAKENAAAGRGLLTPEDVNAISAILAEKGKGVVC